MSQDNPIVALVPAPKKGPLRAPLSQQIKLPADLAPRRSVEVVSDEDLRFEKALARKAQSPTDFIKEASRLQPPLISGALVGVDTLLGFLAALENIIPPETNYPLLTSAKIWFEPSDQPKLFLEGGSHSVWTIVVIDAESHTKEAFEALLPIRRARNVLRATGSAQKRLMIGVDENGICLGSHAVQFGGMLKDFPAQPVMVSSIVRAAMPAFYYQEIIDRVMPARSLHGIDKVSSQGVLLDFDVQDVDGQPRPICIAVATDGDRMHILYLPRVVMESRASRMPPAIRVAAGFFRYMKAVINHDWAAMEFSAEHLVAKGKDFMAVARVVIEPRNQKSDLGSWRKVNVEHRGSWMVDAALLQRAVKGIPGDRFCLRIDSMYNELTVLGETIDGIRYREKISVRRHDGASYVDVRLNKKYFSDAVRACSTKLARLSFEHNPKKQAVAPIVIRGEDEQFKAIVMPIAERSNDA